MSKSVVKRLKAAERHIQKLEREIAVLIRIRDRLVKEHQVVLGQKLTTEALLYTVLAAGGIEVPVSQVVEAQGRRVVCQIDEEKKLIRVKRVQESGE